mmetsp:Transcript_135701/g.321563  ORF Transcript_135701/g.321563 Transcript_135701/m.321563 type:complete len:278 (+) Transcript_135701:494-1327(+)
MNRIFISVAQGGRRRHKGTGRLPRSVQPRGPGLHCRRAVLKSWPRNSIVQALGRCPKQEVEVQAGILTCGRLIDLLWPFGLHILPSTPGAACILVAWLGTPVGLQVVLWRRLILLSAQLRGEGGCRGCRGTVDCLQLLLQQLPLLSLLLLYQPLLHLLLKSHELLRLHLLPIARVVLRLRRAARSLRHGRHVQQRLLHRQLHVRLLQVLLLRIHSVLRLQIRSAQEGRHARRHATAGILLPAVVPGLRRASAPIPRGLGLSHKPRRLGAIAIKLDTG